MQLILQMMLSVPALASSTFTSKSTSAVTSGTDVYQVRPFSSETDQDNLAELCKDLWGGNDYVPNVAPLYEQDPSCEFVIMEDPKTAEMVAAGSRCIVAISNKDEGIWIEAIRVSSKVQGRGIATALMKELCQRSKDDGVTEILSCTAHDNHAMKKVFGKAGVEMEHVSTVYCLDIPKLKSLPGWSATDVNVDKEIEEYEEHEPENILKALDVEHLVHDNARAEHWENVESEQELESLLSSIRKYHKAGSGHLPGFYKLLWSSEELRSSIRKGLVRKLCRENDDGNYDGNGNCNDNPPAIMALSKDHKIRSFRSKYVCSIAATTAHDFDSALWHACREEHVARLGGNRAFMVAFDRCFGESSPLLESLPLDRIVSAMHRRQL